MLKKLTVHDFLVLREPFESGRQSPGSLGVALILGSLLQILMLTIEHYLMKPNYYPNAAEIFKYHLCFSLVLTILSLVYVISHRNIRSQRIQYLLSIVVSHNLSTISFLILMIFLLGTVDGISPSLLQNLTKGILLCGAIVFLITSIRFYILLKKGAYRKGSKTGLLRGKLEKNIGAYLPTLIASGTGISLIIHALVRNVTRLDLDVITFVLIAVLIINTMLFVLPEQLVILYCKYRFLSFNFDQNGNLYSVSKDTKGKKKNGNRKKTAHI
ncbi:hypothetical protein [Heyndrickxia faecalis]|uniref:hypothetical protein n=1 Tax=Heyndrickxia faecalis TaxID=2824910 RepID=UPI003D25AA4A